MATDEEITSEVMADPFMHALHHAKNLDELDSLRCECEAVQSQVDALCTLMLRLAGALNAVLAVPIEIDVQLAVLYQHFSLSASPEARIKMESVVGALKYFVI